MDLRQLEILQAIAETGSFTACGKKLHVSQSAISRQILLLEDELGEPLFLRVGRQVRMTPAAESLVQLGQRVFLDVRETVGSITDRTRELRGTLRLSGGMTVCLYVFPPLLKHLRRVHPHLDVRLTVALAGRSVQEIRGGRVDAGLLTLPVEETDLVTVPALREELLLVTAPTHQLAKRRKVQARDLAGLPFVLFEVGSATRKVIDNFFASQSIEPTIVMDTENVEIIKAMVKTGLGVGIVPYQAVARVKSKPGSCSAPGSTGTSWCARPGGSTRGRTGCRGSWTSCCWPSAPSATSSGWRRGGGATASSGDPSSNQMGSIRSFYFRCTSPVRILYPMSNERDRVISITLSEAEWQAFIARQPQPVDWLREQIRAEAGTAAPQQAQTAA